MKVLLSLLLMMSFILPQTALARKNRVKARQKAQKARIKQGVRSGELTKREAKRLKRGQKRIQYAKKKAKADGEVTKKEARKLRKMQNRQSKKIYKQKHDNQSRSEE